MVIRATATPFFPPRFSLRNSAPRFCDTEEEAASS